MNAKKIETALKSNQAKKAALEKKKSETIAALDKKKAEFVKQIDGEIAEVEKDIQTYTKSLNALQKLQKSMEEQLKMAESYMSSRKGSKSDGADEVVEEEDDDDESAADSGEEENTIEVLEHDDVSQNDYQESLF